MDDKRAEDEFARIELYQEVDRKRGFITQYEEGLAFARRAIEDAQYKIGRIDERLEGE